MFARRVSLRITLLMLWALSVQCRPGVGDGGFFMRQMYDKRDMPQIAHLSSPEQKAIIIRDGTSHEILLLQTTYHGSAADFAWVIPVPGRPAREDVFLANPQVLQQMDQRTGPMTRTVLRDPFESIHLNQQRGMMAGPLGGPGAASSEASPRVVVYERMPVGDYDASILSATGRGVLVDWLNQNGYQFPRDAEPIADDYVARGWTFVALRVRPQMQRKEALLADVAPIGLRFPTKSLVYPLKISKVSASDVTTLLLLVLDNDAVSCTELPTVTFPMEMKATRGSTYLTLVRDLLAKYSGQALLCEARKSVSTDKYDWLRSTSLRKDGKKIVLSVPLIATRLWAELPVKAMRDLTFVPSGGTPFDLLIEKTADLPTPAWAYLFGTPKARFVWTALAFTLVLIALWPQPEVRRQEEAAPRILRVCGWAVALLVVVAAIMLLPASLNPSEYQRYRLTGQPPVSLPRLNTSDEAMIAGQILLTLWVVPGFFLIRDMKRKLPRGVAERAVPWLLLLMLIVLAFRPVTIVGDTVHLELGALRFVLVLSSLVGLAMLCWPFAVALIWVPQVAPRSITIAKSVTWALLSLFILVPLVGGLCDRAMASRPYKFEVMAQQAAASTRLETALKMFRDATGAYPKQLTDLMSPHLPTKGLDVSGNEVELAGSPPMPMLPELPVDPLTGRNDTWVYDVRSPVLVESGAFELTVTTR